MRSNKRATRELLKTHVPDGRIYLRKIGTEPEYALAARLLASDMQAKYATVSN